MKTISITKKSIFTAALMLFIFTSNVVIGRTNITTSNGNSYSFNSSSKNGVRTYHVKNGQKDFRIEYEGEITLSNDDKDITAISRGGFIEIKKSSFGTKRRILIHNESGTLVKKYFVGWSEKPFRTEGRKWLAEILPEILRTTTIAAKSRVNRFYRKNGASGVLAEVRKMKSDYVKSAYIKLLLEKNLNTSDLVKTIESTGNYIKSDHYVSQILKSNQKAFLKNDRTVTAYINATKNIKSDHYATGILKKVIEDKNISDKQLGSLLEITKGIKSDHYITQLLKSIMSNRKMNDANMSKILALTKGINSDHYVSSIITEMMKNNNLNASSINTIVKMVEDNISSSHYISTIYKKVASKKLTDSQLIMIIESSARTIKSSHSLTSVLVALSNQVNSSSSKVKNAYKTAAKKIKSDTYYGRVMKVLN